jgi:hypothetical protein
MDVTIAAENGNFLMVARGDRFSVIERRNNSLYNCHDDKRNSIPLDQLAAISAIVDDGDWVDRSGARRRCLSLDATC